MGNIDLSNLSLAQLDQFARAYYSNPNGFLIDSTGMFIQGTGNGSTGAAGSDLTEREQEELSSGLSGSGTASSGTVSGGTVADGTATAGAAAGDKDEEAKDSDDKKAKKSDKSKPKYVYKTKTDVKKAIDKFYDATYCCGTKDAQMEEALSGIDSSNVMDYVKTWNKFHSKEKGESFVEAFIWDADGTQKTEYGKQIVEALREKADELDIMDEEMAEYFAIIDNELRSSVMTNNNITKYFDKIIEKIGKAEADQLAENEPDEDKKEEVRKKAMEYIKPYDASYATKGIFERICGGIAKYFDGLYNFMLGGAEI